MSFSSEVKNELARVPLDSTCCLKAELASLLRMGGSMRLRDCRIGMDFSTENAALARRVLQLAKNDLQLPAQAAAIRMRQLKKNNRYLIRLLPSAETENIVALLGIFPSAGYDFMLKNFFNKACCRRAFLRGAFLAGGSISKPTGAYHLEIVARPEEMAPLILKALKTMNINGKLTERKGDCLIYLKEADAIINFLSLIGAHGALLEFENVRVVKDMRNNVNRVVNCETANLEKTVGAALKQLAVINYLDNNLGLNKLTGALREAAQLRLRHPEASLGELAELSAGGVGKAGMNHRFRTLKKIAEQAGYDDGT